MTADPDLTDALRRVRSLTGTREPDATLLRRLAIEGAEAMILDEGGHRQNVAELMEEIRNGAFEVGVEEIDRRTYAGLPPLYGR